jgi:tetratricopeptide (TPR) repeat protein
MQNIAVKKLSIILTFMLGLVLFQAYSSHAETVGDQLQKADSLYQSKKYTEAFEYYKNALENHQIFSPAMLLKMAYIKEGLGEYSKAMYYLNLYYLNTANDAVLAKMEELAEKHKLKGYEYHDWEYFLSMFHRYHSQVIMLLLAFAVFLFSLIVFQKRRTQRRPTTAGVFYVITLGIIFVLINYGAQYRRGIIHQDFTYLMSDASAASKVVDVVKQGHRVRVLDETDIWMKIRWEEQEAFIKKSQLQILD